MMRNGYVGRAIWLMSAALVFTIGQAGAAAAQSSASTYSYGTYNPVQAAINRNSMNAAILRQSGHRAHAATAKRTAKHRARPHHGAATSGKSG